MNGPSQLLEGELDDLPVGEQLEQERLDLVQRRRAAEVHHDDAGLDLAHAANITPGVRRLAADQPRLQREPGEPRDGADLQLPHQALAVGLDGAVADAELLRRSPGWC